MPRKPKPINSLLVEFGRQKWTISTARLRIYGLTGAQYQSLLAEQDGLCAICRRLDVRPDQLVIDHDHSDGAVRGLLRGACNTAMGLLRDSRGRLVRALRYLRAARARRKHA